MSEEIRTDLKDRYSSGERSVELFTELIDLGLMRVRGEAVSEAFKKNFLDFVGALIEVLDTGWDFIDHQKKAVQFENLRSIYGMLLFFPERTIESEAGEKSRHTVRELFLKVDFTQNGDRLGVQFTSCARTSFSKAEYTSGYIHSHGQSVTWSRDRSLWTSVCTGSGEINPVQSSFNSSNSFDNAKRYIFALITWSGWESISGVPHIRISNIQFNPGGGQNSLQGFTPSPQEFTSKVLADLNTKTLPLDIFDVLQDPVNPRDFTVKLSEEALRGLSELSDYRRHVCAVFNGRVFTVESTVAYFELQNTGWRPEIPRQNISFRNEVFSFKIYDLETTEETKKTIKNGYTKEIHTDNIAHCESAIRTKISTNKAYSNYFKRQA